MRTNENFIKEEHKMDILMQLENLLYEDASEDCHGPEYHELMALERRHLNTLAHAAGEETVEKLTDVQSELLQAQLVRSFFYGLRLGAALLEY